MESNIHTEGREVAKGVYLEKVVCWDMTAGISSDITALSFPKTFGIFQRESHCLQCASSIMDEDKDSDVEQEGGWVRERRTTKKKKTKGIFLNNYKEVFEGTAQEFFQPPLSIFTMLSQGDAPHLSWPQGSRKAENEQKKSWQLINFCHCPSSGNDAKGQQGCCPWLHLFCILVACYVPQ